MSHLTMVILLNCITFMDIIIYHHEKFLIYIFCLFQQRWLLSKNILMNLLEIVKGEESAHAGKMTPTHSVQLRAMM